MVWQTAQVRTQLGVHHAVIGGRLSNSILGGTRTPAKCSNRGSLPLQALLCLALLAGVSAQHSLHASSSRGSSSRRLTHDTTSIQWSQGQGVGRSVVASSQQVSAACWAHRHESASPSTLHTDASHKSSFGRLQVQRMGQHQVMHWGLKRWGCPAPEPSCAYLCACHMISYKGSPLRSLVQHCVRH